MILMYGLCYKPLRQGLEGQLPRESGLPIFIVGGKLLRQRWNWEGGEDTKQAME